MPISSPLRYRYSKKTLLAVLFVLGLSELTGQGLIRELAVRHDHDPWGSCQGILKLSPAGIEFESDKKKHSRTWRWTEIQNFDRLAADRLRILTWEDRRWYPLAERFFDFRLEPGSALEEDLMGLVSAHLSNSMTNRVPVEVETEHRLPVKHRHTWGGCQGELRIGAEQIVFFSEDFRHSRTWLRVRDISSFWSSHPFELELQVFEQNEREFQRLKRFSFDLKQRMPASLYRELRRSTTY